MKEQDTDRELRLDIAALPDGARQTIEYEAVSEDCCRLLFTMKNLSVGVLLNREGMEYVRDRIGGALAYLNKGEP